MKRKKNFKTIENNPNMGLNDNVCKNKVGYCTKKDVFLNGQQISAKMCGCKNYNEETKTYSPCSYFIDKEKKPQKFQEKLDKANSLHTPKKKINKHHCEIIETTDKNGNVIEQQVPICISINLQDKFKQVMDKHTCMCKYNNRPMGEDLCKKRGCRKGQFGKFEANSCPYLLEYNQKKSKKKKPTNIKTSSSKTYNISYKDKEEPEEIVLNEDEVMFFGRIYKKSEIGMKE